MLSIYIDTAVLQWLPEKIKISLEPVYNNTPPIVQWPYPSATMGAKKGIANSAGCLAHFPTKTFDFV